MLPQIEASINRRMVNSAALFNDLVGALQQRMRHRETERSGGLQVDRQLEARGLHNRQLGRNGALQNASDIIADALTDLAAVRTVAHQPAGGDEFGPFVNGGDTVAASEGDKLIGDYLEIG